LVNYQLLAEAEGILSQKIEVGFSEPLMREALEAKGIVIPAEISIGTQDLEEVVIPQKAGSGFSKFIISLIGGDILGLKIFRNEKLTNGQMHEKETSFNFEEFGKNLEQGKKDAEALDQEL